MKKLLASILALTLVLALVTPAFAEGVIIKYVNKSSLKVYKEQSTKSKVLKKLQGADKLLIEMFSDDGKWAGVLVEDTKHGGQKLGWVQTKYLSDDLPQSVCKHKWSDWTVYQEPTCTEKGYRTRTCTKCGLLEEDETKKLKHSYGKWKVTKEATCAKEGERVRTCKVCGYEDKEKFKEDHTFGAWTILVDPTCSSSGEREHTCRVCGYTEEQKLDPLPHDYEYRIIVEATDHSSGTRAKVCRNCGYTTAAESYDPEGTLRRGDRSDSVKAVQQLLVDQGYLNVGGADGIFGGGTEKAVMKFQQDQGLSADGVVWPQTRKRMDHDFGPWTTVKALTRSEAGERVRVCKDCGYEQHEVVEAGTTYEFKRRGEDIRALQQILKSLGFDAGTFDGIYGNKLDKAFEGFAAANGLVFQAGKVRPVDVDALINAWFDKASEDEWKGEGDSSSPVNLALTVIPTSDESEDSEVTTYSWTLTNLGSEKCMFNALLLTYGENPDFRKNDLVMELDGFELQPNCGNSTSGSFAVAKSWGEGNLNFAAMAVSEKTGAKWLSNTVTFEVASASAVKTVAPLPVSIDVNALEDGVYPVAFDRGDVFGGTSGVFMNAVHVYAMDLYDAVEVNALLPGDTLVVDGEAYMVDTVEDRDGVVMINGGLGEENGHDLMPLDQGGVYRVLMYDDLATYTELGVVSLTVDPSATYTDSSDLEADPVTVGIDGIVNAMQTSENEFFDEYNTTLRVEAGKVVEINRIFVP